MIVFRLFAFVILILLYINCINASVGSYITPFDKNRLKKVLETSLSSEIHDVPQIYYGVLGLKTLMKTLDPKIVRDFCPKLQRIYKPEDTAEVTFFALSAWTTLGCSGKLDVDVKYVKSILESEASPIAEVRYAAEISKILGQPIANPSKISQLVQAKLKEDDSLQSLGHILHTASCLGTAGKFAQDHIEDIVVQADEVDGKLIQWEGGLSTTSLLVTGLLRLPGAKPFTQVQADKIASYLLTRRTVQTSKGILALLEAASALSSSTVSPTSISVSGPSYVTIEKPNLKIRICDILGDVLKSPPAPVSAQSATRLADDVVVLSKQPLTSGESPSEYVLPLRLDSGQYKIDLAAGSHSSTIVVRILGPVSVQSFEIGLVDSDGSTQPQLTKLQPSEKLKTVLQADSSHHLVAKFSLSRSVHQTFLRLHSDKKEIIFVAEQDSNKVYKAEVNLVAELFHSGKFNIELILGDSVMSNPLRWDLGIIDVNIGVAETAKKSTRAPKPEIQHLFRPAEKRPPEVVSLVFTALTAAPLVLLLISWLSLGINFGNFTVLALPFHLGFGAVLALFTCFWLKLDMFTTCSWLIPIGGFTFFAGHHLLSHMAQRSHKKHEKADK